MISCNDCIKLDNYNNERYHESLAASWREADAGKFISEGLEG